jgi:hypothetical protein
VGLEVLDMKESVGVRIGEVFKPSPRFKKLYYYYLLLGIAFGVLTWYIPVMVPILLFTPPFASIFAVEISIPIIIIIALIALWIPRYYDSIFYKLTDTEIIWSRGVWFKNTGVVPYDRITNIDISQGPISRSLGIASLRIQTAGYSGRVGPEIKIEGVERYEELRDLILSFVKGKKPTSVEMFEEGVESKILDELVKIRRLLERSLEEES